MARKDSILLPEAADAPGGQRRKICIDATGLLAWRGALAGIQRLEDFMVRAALADPDPDVEVVTLDFSSHCRAAAGVRSGAAPSNGQE
ncbi:hypothetical protein [Mesorhizobium sp.]|uniref:hypothetical protein n=1 Tax=Mesorhizobium sp. TaxID=1871066 RepID=UPI0025FDC2BA|nr:hypothetical protein [Mesorhizobium sp.]